MYSRPFWFPLRFVIDQEKIVTTTFLLQFDREAFKTCKNTIQLRIYVCVKFLNYYFSIGDSKQKIFPTKSCS